MPSTARGTPSWRQRLLGTRLGRVFASVAASFGERAVTVLISFVSVPIALSYLGKDGYGLWATVTSLVAMLSFVDLGVGNGVMNAISTASGHDDRAAIGRAVSNGLAVLVAVGAAFAVAFALVHPFVPWGHVLGVDAPDVQHTAAAAMLTLGLLFALAVPTGLVQRMLYGLQLGYLNSLSQVGGSVLSLAMILAVVRFDLGVVGMVAAFMLAPMVASWVAGALLWSRNAYLRFSRRQLDRRQMRALLGTGAQFFFVQLAFALCFASDNLIIARTLSVEDVTTYAVHQKLFSPISMVVGFVVMPLWPAFGEAIARGDTTWVRRVLRRSALLLLSTAVIGSVVLLALAEPLFAVWLRGQVAPEMALCAALAVWMVVDATGKAYAMFLNGADLLRPQVWIAAVFVPVCIGLKILFAARWGVAGIPLAMAIAWIVTHAVPYALIIRRWNAQHAPQR